MSDGEAIVHYGGVKLRVVGNGNLIPTLYSLDKVISQQLVAIPMLASTDRQRTRLCNFQSQRATLELKTTELNERFKIHLIIIFAQNMFEDFPSVQ